jgi:glycosyltransferase 2 family protein
MSRRLIDRLRGPTAKRIGLAGCIVALTFFAHALVTAVAQADVERLLSQHGLALLVAALLYGLAYVPMTRAWIVLARVAGAEPEPRALTAIFLTSQIAKYLPGNVAQFIGRAYAGHCIGIPLTVTGLALTLEVAGVLIASALLVALALGLGFGSGVPGTPVGYLLPVAGVAILVGGAVAVGAGQRSTLRRAVRPFAGATLLHMLTLLLVAGGQLTITLSLLGHADLATVGAIVAAILASWLVGFIAPGVPAGLGLREMTFVALLSGAHLPAALVLSAAAFRLITVGGDLAAWLVGLYLRAGGERRLTHGLAPR